MKPGNKIINGSATTGGDDGEGTATCLSRPWRTIERQLKYKFWKGHDSSIDASQQ